MKLKEGDRVILKSDDGGILTGIVTGFTHSGNVVVIQPNQLALRAWFPKGYHLGSAHWNARITKVEK